MEVTIAAPRSIFGRPRHARENRRRKQIAEMMLERESNINHLFSFKTIPRMEPDTVEARPITQCCSICLPSSEVMITDNVKHLGLVDCFVPPTTSPYNPMWVRMFPYFSHYGRVCQFGNAYQLPTLKELQNDPKLLSLYSGNVSKETQQSVLLALEQLQVKKVWNWMFSTFIRVSAWMYQKYMQVWYFESVFVHQGQIELLREVNTKKLPIIYVPTYRSSWDASVIMWVLAHNGMPSPFFISSHNSRKKITSYYGGIGGALQVKLDGVESDSPYSSAVSCYLRALIRKRNNLMFTMEVGRSRTGTPTTQLYGTELLKIIYDEYVNNKIEDAYFVPVSVAYESLPDIEELLPSSKSCTSRNPLKLLYSSLCNFFNLTKFLKGRVKVDFSQPISLREFEQSLKKMPKVLRAIEGSNDSFHRSRDCTYLKWDSADSAPCASSLYGALGPLYPDGSDYVKEATILDVMNFHLVHDAYKCGSVLPVHLVAFLLMKKFSGGVFLDQLLKDLPWIIQVVKSNNRDFAFAISEADMESIAFRGIQYLGEHVTCSWNEKRGTYEIKPSTETASLRRLEYYAGYLLPDFILEAVVATAIFALIGTQLTVLRGYDIGIQIKDADFIFHCRRVYEVLTNTFIPHPPCLTSEAAIRRKITAMSDAGRLFLVMRSSRNYMWNDDSDFEYDNEIAGFKPDTAADATDIGFSFVPEEIKVSTSQATFEHMNFYRNLLLPYLEIYTFLMTSLKVLLRAPEKDLKEMEVEKLEKHLVECLLQEKDGQFKRYRQLLGKDIVKSFLASCEDHEILYSRHDVDPLVFKTYYGLQAAFIDENGTALDEQADAISFYVTK